MSKRNNNYDICLWLAAIWSAMFTMMLIQCSSQEDIHRALQNIEHELRMLRYK